jgi:hypothetical protein
MDAASLRALFTKPYGAPAPTAEQWRALYADDVHFQDPTQERQGLTAYLEAQAGLLKRCDDVFLEPGASSSSTPAPAACCSTAKARSAITATISTSWVPPSNRCRWWVASCAGCMGGSWPDWRGPMGKWWKIRLPAGAGRR